VGQPWPGTTAGAQVSRKSLLADVANLTARNGRLAAHITRLERCLTEALGQTTWETSGLGAPADIETLTRRTTELEQQILDLRAVLAVRDEDLEAARADNRELMDQLNRWSRHVATPQRQGGGVDRQMHR
jgi:cell division protein FtsB